MTPLLQIKNLQVDFNAGQAKTTALKGISFDVPPKQTVAIVGESGSGKSVTALSILQLLPSAAHYSGGEALFAADGGLPTDLLQLTEKTMRHIRGNRIAMIFQEPMSSLNPVYTCGEQVSEAIRQHQKINGAAAKQKTLDLFQKVQLPRPEAIYSAYPHQLSGGQKQRVMIAMAMSCQPSLLICDEPTTALDVTVQKAILGLIRDLQVASGMGVIFITHDIGLVADFADRVVVLFKGRVVEQGAVKEVLSAPQHPYTRALLNCRPNLHSKGERLPVVSDFLDTGTDNPLLSEPIHPAKVAIEPIAGRRVIMRIEDLRVWFPFKKTFTGQVKSYTRAVDGVSFEVYQGETLGCVGESGCGKTTLGRTLLRLIEPHSGKIIFNDRNLFQQSASGLIQLRKQLQIVFQDPYSSLNPTLPVGAAITEPMRVHNTVKSKIRARTKNVEPS